jgi:hypothetical protein
VARFAPRVVVVSALVLCCGAAPWTRAGLQSPSAPTSAKPPDASLTPEEMRQFLLTAKVIAHKDSSKGITHPYRLTLTNGTLTHEAFFSTVQENQPVMKFDGGRTELDFVDSYAYNIAAYGVAEAVGLADMMPVTVEIKWNGHKGSLAWAVDTMMDEQTRLAKKVEPPDREAWNQQMYRMRVFSQLVADTDRNLGNVLIDRNWKLWMIDFTRAFRHTRTLLAPGDLQRCDRQLLARLRELTPEALEAKTKPFIGRAEIDPMIARRDLIVQTFEKLIAERGEARVLY